MPGNSRRGQAAQSGQAAVFLWSGHLKWPDQFETGVKMGFRDVGRLTFFEHELDDLDELNDLDELEVDFSWKGINPGITGTWY